MIELFTAIEARIPIIPVLLKRISQDEEYKFGDVEKQLDFDKLDEGIKKEMRKVGIEPAEALPLIAKAVTSRISW